MSPHIEKFIKLMLNTLAGIAVGVVAATCFWKKLYVELNSNYWKLSGYYHIFNDWLSNEYHGRKTEAFFVKNGYKSVAIYGMKEFGVRLYEMLKDSDVKVEYVIDRNPEIVSEDIRCYKPSDELPKVDVIVVTASYYFNEISRQLQHTGYQIVSIEDVIYYKHT